MANYDQYMAESGQQGTLDALRSSGQYDAAKAAWESGGGDYGFGSNLGQINADIDKFIDDLKGIVGDDYDLAAKWIEKNFQDALGTNDAKRAEFLKKVANQLEDEVGTIAFDLQTGEYRANEDRNTALSRLREDGQLMRQQLDKDAAQIRQDEMGNLNARGLINGPRDQVVGLGAEQIRNTEDEIAKRIEALDRKINRAEADINLNYNRGIEDLTTQSRRLAYGAQDEQAFGMEKAEIDRERKIKELEAQKNAMKRMAPSLASELTYSQSGY